MATAIGNLVINLSANTARFRQGMGRVQKTLGVTTGLVRGLGGAMATMLGPLAGIYGIFRLAAGGEKFNRSMRSSLAIMGEVSETMRTEMRTVAIETAKVTIHSAEATARAYFFLASAGMTAAQSIEAMPAVAQFAQAGMFDLSRATELATDAQHALGIAVKDPIKNLQSLTRVMDVLVKANTLADATTEQFATALTTKAGAAFKIVGKEVEEAVAVLAALAMAGRKGEEAGTQLSRVMIGLKINAINNADAFKRLGIGVFDANDEMRNMADIVLDLENALGSMNDRQQQATIMALGFTKKTSDLVALLIGMSDKIRMFEADLDKAGGTMKEVADKQMTSFQKGWAELAAGVVAASSAMMKFAGPVLGHVMTEMGKFISELERTLDALAEFTKGVDKAMGDAPKETQQPEFIQALEGFIASPSTLIRDTRRGFQMFVAAHAQIIEDSINAMTGDAKQGVRRYRANLLAMWEEEALEGAELPDLVNAIPLDEGAERMKRGIASLTQTVDDGIMEMVNKWRDRVRDIGKSPLKIELETILAGIPKHEPKFAALREEIEGIYEALIKAQLPAEDWANIWNPAADATDRARDALEGMREEIRLFGLEGAARQAAKVIGPFDLGVDPAVAGELNRAAQELDDLRAKARAQEVGRKAFDDAMRVADEQARQNAAGDNRQQFAGATQRGTAESFSQILAAVGGGKDKLLEVSKKNADANERTAMAVEAVAGEEGEWIGIPPGGGI